MLIALLYGDDVLEQRESADSKVSPGHQHMATDRMHLATCIAKYRVKCEGGHAPTTACSGCTEMMASKGVQIAKMSPG